MRGHFIRPSREGLHNYLFRHNHNKIRETSWLPLVLVGEVTRSSKTVVVDDKGVEKVTDGECTITLSTLLDLNQPFQEFDYRAWQRRVKSENPILDYTKKKATQRAWESRGVPFSWECSNKFCCTMMPRIADYLKYCATGVEKDIPKIISKSKRQKESSSLDPKVQVSPDQRGLARTLFGTKNAPFKWQTLNPNNCKIPEVQNNFKSLNTPSANHGAPAVTGRAQKRHITGTSDCDKVLKKKVRKAHRDEVPKSDATKLTKDNAKKKEAVGLKPAVPSIDVQEARILYRNPALVKHLRTHPRGDWIKNPHRCVSAKHVAEKTKERSASAIKSVIREWLLTTPQGRRALAFADITEGELSIDRLIPRNDKSGTGLNCIYNLYMMPTRHNSYFGDQLTSEKCKYAGERAYKLAKGAHDAFVRDAERDYDWDDGFAKRAEFIINAC